MSDWNKTFEDEVADLRAVRDELRLQIHLGKEEARERWEKLEQRWQHLETKMGQVGEGVRDSAEDVANAARLLMEEIRSGYRHIRELL